MFTDWPDDWRCIHCGKPKHRCICGILCARCGQPKCQCENHVRPEHRSPHDADPARHQTDEELADAIRRMYGTDEQHSRAYWRGWTRAAKGLLGRPCPFPRGTKSYHDFYRGVSDFRYRYPREELT